MRGKGKGIVPLKVHLRGATAPRHHLTPNTFDMRACPCPLLYIAVICSTQETYSVALRPLIAAVAEPLMPPRAFVAPSMKLGSGAFTRITNAVGTLSSAAF